MNRKDYSSDYQKDRRTHSKPNFLLKSNDNKQFSDNNTPFSSSQRSNTSSYQRRPRYYNNRSFQPRGFSYDTQRSDIERSLHVNVSLEHELFDGQEVEKGINFDQYENIPVEVSGCDVPPCVQRFEEVENIHPQLLWNIDRSGYTNPTPVQKHAFSISVKGRDIMAVAQTGSGKTAAYLLPMIQVLLETGGRDRHPDFTPYAPIALVLVPTRELAVQVHLQAKKFLYRTGMRSVAIYGGKNSQQQLNNLRGGVEILVATPGRLVDFLSCDRLTLGNIRFLVLDEADRMLDMGFQVQIKEVLSERYKIAGPGERQTMMFSATFPCSIQLLAKQYMGDYVFVAVGKVGGACESVRQELVYAESNDKKSVLLDFFNSVEEGSVLIFVQRKFNANKVETFLKRNGINALSIHGDKSQYEREFAISSFKRGVCKVMVATDVASRGLDIPNVGYVVNYDMALNIEDYVHRIGRTGRIGNEGVALTIISDMEHVKVLEQLRDLLKESNEKVPKWMNELIQVRKRGKYQSNYGRQERRGGQMQRRFTNYR